jgi:hypothetical protein
MEAFLRYFDLCTWGIASRLGASDLWRPALGMLAVGKTDAALQPRRGGDRLWHPVHSTTASQKAACLHSIATLSASHVQFADSGS